MQSLTIKQLEFKIENRFKILLKACYAMTSVHLDRMISFSFYNSTRDNIVLLLLASLRMRG